MDRFASPSRDPEQTAANTELSRLLERLIEALPDGIRSVFVLREVEGMNTSETAEALDISEESVRVRLHRARASLRDSLAAHAIRDQRRLFAFHAVRCDRVVRNVLDRITANPISR
jgi:RNA polymerase sigma-70 factor (ECF subfamily)